MQEAMELERIEWTPTNKDDLKFQEKMSNKMKAKESKEPTRKQVNQ